MAVGSLEFFFFLFVVAFLFHLLKGKASLWLLLGASTIFYASFLNPLWFLSFLCVILATWGLGLTLQSLRGTTREGRIFLSGIVVLLFFLGFLKYRGIAANAVNTILAWIGHPVQLPVPAPLLFLGVSYYLFQSISYLADIHFGVIDAERNLAALGLYLCFFPKVVQGPLERPGTLLPQFRAPYRFDALVLKRGIFRIGWGLFKKAVVAERLSPGITILQKDLVHSNGPELYVGLWIFGLQLYCDFSGYTDMAIGAAALFNIRLTENFDEPYLARSMRDFWHRWHISLSTWILDYVYQPLQMAFRDLGNAGAAVALFLSFFFVGIWHAGTLPFVIFGLIQGTYMAASIAYRPVQKALHKRLAITKAPWLPIWQIFFTLQLVVFSFLFFSSATFMDAENYFRGLLHGWMHPTWSHFSEAWPNTDSRSCLALGLVILLIVEPMKHRVHFEKWPTLVRWSTYFLLGILLIFLVRFYSQKQFIYAQF
jgi:D-alanyl-lipoteichoic acid acyltransferase DltB (MBOAT superfamily)